MATYVKSNDPWMDGVAGGTEIDAAALNNIDGGIDTIYKLPDAKGELVGSSAADTLERVPAPSDDQVLVGDLAQSTGVLWQKIANAQVADGAAIGHSKLSLDGAIVTGLNVRAEASPTVGPFHVGDSTGADWVSVLKDGTLMVSAEAADHSLTSGTSAGSIVTQSNRFFRSVKDDGTNTIRLIGSNTSDQIVIGEAGLPGGQTIRVGSESLRLDAGSLYWDSASGEAQFTGINNVIRFTALTGGATFFAARVAGDTQYRFVFDTNGMEFGPGGVTVPDVQFRRLAANVLGTGSGDKLVANGGLGVGNSAAATTPGTVTKKMQVFDAAGVSLGFVAIYDAIT